MLIFLFVSCSTTEEKKSEFATEGEFSDCDPLDNGLCALPFPSSFYQTQNIETPTGILLDFRPGSLPINADGVQTEPELWNEKDGFSTLTPIMTYVPNLSAQGLLRHDEIHRYMDDDVRTVIIDVDTQERVPHWAELDMSHDQEDRRVLRLYPAKPMEWGHHYIVGIRNLQDEDGNRIEPNESFLALRNHTPTGEYDIDGRSALYEHSIFPTLENTGFARDELYLAWDFQIASREHTLRQVLHMRSDALPRIDGGGPYSINEVERFTVEENEHVAKRIYGTMTVPNYTEDIGPDVLLTRDEDGLPYYNGTRDIEFTIIVPHILIEEQRPGSIIQYGHGLMGSQSEVRGGYLGEIANRYGYVLLAVDWTGMSAVDLSSIIFMLIDGGSRFGIIPERCQQGFIEQMAALETLQHNLAADPELLIETDNGESISIVSTEEAYYYGNSQGGILGNAYFALSPHFTRGVFGVSGAPYSVLLPRSVDFDQYFMIFKTMYPDFMDISLWIGLMQTLWDPSEPTAYLDALSINPLPNTPVKNIILQIAQGDAQVTPLGAHIQARGIGAKLLQPSFRDIWGLDTMESGETGSALVEWNYNLDVPFESIPPEGDDPHSRPRKDQAAQEQMHHFFQTGEIINFCDGTCGEE